MKKTLFVKPILTLIIIAVLVFGNCYLFKNNQKMKDEILRLTEEAKYDAVDLAYISEDISKKNAIIDYFASRSIISAVEKSDFVWWDEISTNEDKAKFSSGMGIKVPDVNYEEETIIYSVGRKIESMRRYETDWFLGRMKGAENPEGFIIAYVGVVTFSEEYFENQVFFYKLYRLKGKVQGQVFVSSVLESPFYILKDGISEFMANSLPLQAHY